MNKYSLLIKRIIVCFGYPQRFIKAKILIIFILIFSSLVSVLSLIIFLFPNDNTTPAPIVFYEKLNNNKKSQLSDINSTLETSPLLNSIDQPKQLLANMGHLLYLEADKNRLMIIASYAQKQYQRFEYLDVEAGQALMKLIYAARDEGVWLVPVSGFRSIERQTILFDEQVKRLGSIEAATKVSAPPGYSEHHTGYVIDLTDGRFPKQDITYKFANTDAYRWLTKHAHEFGFEQSFPLNNLQGISYEPWHWRFIGSQRATTIFTQAHNLKR